MKTKSTDDEIYIGREAGKEIHEKIKNAKSSVKVVSPYLSPDYVKELISLHKKGVKVTLITCDQIETNSYSDFRPSSLVKKQKIEKKSMKDNQSFIDKIINLFTNLFISEDSFTYEPIFRIRVFDSASGKNPKSTELIHSKIFVIDEETAFLGSVNLTYSGFKTHYETAIKVKDKFAVREISNEIENLYNSHELKAKSVEDWMNIQSKEWI
jgi:phosphatidylserine/phosphatidylglycerophosphate/cardiolipin synthase-like enzyme